MKTIISIIVTFGLFLGICGGELPKVEGKPQAKSNEPTMVIKMSEIKQTLSGLDKEVTPGTLVKVKVSPLPTSTNTITAVYKFGLLENGKLSNNYEVLTSSERNTDPAKTTSDLIFTTQPMNTIRYQVLFSAVYIETKPGTTEIISVQNGPINVYEVKVAGYVPPDVPPDVVIPDGNFGLIRSVYLESIKLGITKELKVKLFTNLSNVFSGMSSKIAAGVYKDDANEDTQIKRIEDFLKETKTLVNNATKDSGVDPKVLDGNIDVVVKSALEKAYADGKMRKFADYQAAWAEIAEGYRLALKNVAP